MVKSRFSRANLSIKEIKDVEEAYAILGVIEDIRRFSYAPDELDKFIERKMARIKVLREKEYISQKIKDELNKLLITE